MSRVKKKFDCVQMKWDVQGQIDKEMEGLSAEEARELQRRRIESDPVLGPYLRKVAGRSLQPNSKG